MMLQQPQYVHTHFKENISHIKDVLCCFSACPQITTTILESDGDDITITILFYLYILL